MALEGFDGVFLYGIGVVIALIVIEVNQVSGVIILVPLLTFWAVSGKMSYFSTLEACIRGVSGSGSISLVVVLGTVPLIVVVVPLPSEVAALVVSLASIIPLSSSRCSVSIDIHGNRGVVHPAWGI